MKRRDLLLSSCALMGVSRASPAQEPATVVYPRHLPAQDSQVNYLVELMQLALQQGPRRYELRPTRSEMVQSRALLELASPRPGLDVFWTMNDAQREGALLPIRIPLERGLIGWRLLLVRRADAGAYAQLSLAELAQRQAGQMGDWPDTRILRANGLPVQTSSHYQGLFEMLAQGRIDYFPRSVLEIDAELQAYGDGRLAVASGLMLHYPAALYLYVRPSRPQLAEDLALGLEALVASGTLERLARRQFGALLARHQVAQRRVLHLQNPLLGEHTPLQRKALWWQPP
jgi:hypothetical protein